MAMDFYKSTVSFSSVSTDVSLTTRYGRCTMEMDNHKPLAIAFDGLFTEDIWSLRSSNRYMSEP